ncbi:ABC transporter substrate-binding protein [Terrilactibacillus laevilacticus]|uniref:ABC transporter substrate-binding protein n=1 Tax=Terrilactibacillus laevilacticus TaxID=1380157 RepID=UPI0015EF71D5|nr:ABC transporter substrate-binding protein [Terrilactibacillus laevilacticus]
MRKQLWIVFILIAVILSGCAQKENGQGKQNVLSNSFAKHEKLAKGKTVRLYMWGGDTHINQYIDHFIAPRLKKSNGITLKRVSMDTPQIIQKLMNEKEAGKKQGTVDLIWLNGDNFKLAKDNGLLYGKIAKAIPNAVKMADPQLMKTDAGEAVNDLEVPWGKTAFTFQFNASKVKQPPLNLDELTAWVKAHPGRFTYPVPDDFTGNTFIRQVIYAQNNGMITEGMPTKAQRQKAYQYLKQMALYLWRQGKTYPKSLQEMDQLYSRGELDFTMGFNERRALPFIKDGTFPSQTRTYAWSVGAVTNAHYLTMSFNTTVPDADLVVMNELLSPSAQYEKLKTDVWGDGTSLQENKLNADWQKNSLH